MLRAFRRKAASLRRLATDQILLLPKMAHHSNLVRVIVVDAQEASLSGAAGHASAASAKEAAPQERQELLSPPSGSVSSSSPKLVKLHRAFRKSSSSSSYCAADSSSSTPTNSHSSFFQLPLERASAVLKAGGIVALPTDTLYGLAGLAQSTDAVCQIYSVKERHNEKPLSICVGNISDVYKWARVHCDETLLERLLPGRSNISVQDIITKNIINIFIIITDQ